MSSAPTTASFGPARSTSALAARLERPPARLNLAVLPTPVERASWLDTGLSEVWIKRDDRSSPIYGGGKVRKLEWILANPPYNTDAPILSVGGIGSHHLLSLALFLKESGRDLHALTFDQVHTTHVRRNLAVLLSTGTRLWHVRRRPALPWAWLGYQLWRKPQRRGVFMGAGASTALGCFGFVEAGFELASQIGAGSLPKPDTIYVTAGSAGTSAGLVLGLALAGISTHLHLVSSVEPWAFNRVLFALKLRQAFAALRQAGLHDGAGALVPWRSVQELVTHAGVTWSIDHSAVGGGYGVPTDPASEAMAHAQAHGVHLETTYTAKCAAALSRNERERRGAAKQILFWNTHAGNDISSRIQDRWQERCPVGLADELKA